MRWGTLQVAESGADGTGDPAERAGQLALFGREEVVARTFDTPEFSGMTFYEVQAKSIINKVPWASRVPFSWTINPYRGCSHACVYCLAGDTPVLLADGTERPIEDLEIGDAIVGTVPGAQHRHYVITHVLDKWTTHQRAYRVRLADGREIVASADHRFLTEEGWAHVLADPPEDRPHLRPGSVLIAGGIEPGQVPHELVGRQVPHDARVAVVDIEAWGAERSLVDITTGTGDFIAAGVVSHNCFARNTHNYLDLDAGLDFDRKVVVKVNAPQLLRRELAKPSWQGEPIAMGTNVDCYQRAEGRYRLMPGIIEALRAARNPFSILTKGTLILRDLDLLIDAATVTQVGVSFSIGSTDRELWRSVEPGTPAPQARLGAIRALTDAGFRVGVLMAPILPYLSDRPDQLRATIAAIAESGAAGVTPIALHLRPGAREWYFQWLERDHPQLVGRYREMYGERAYAPKAYQHRIAELVAGLAREHGLGAGWGRETSR